MHLAHAFDALVIEATPAAQALDRKLGMNPAMKGSAALFGVTRLVRPMPVDYAGPGIKITDEHHPRGFRRRTKGDIPS